MIFTDEVLIAGGVHGIFVFFKVLQQKNVTADHYFWVIPTSYLMSSTDVIVTSVVAVRAVQTAGDWAAMIPLMLSLGTCSGVAALAAMWIHNKFIGRK